MMTDSTSTAAITISTIIAVFIVIIVFLHQGRYKLAEPEPTSTALPS